MAVPYQRAGLSLGPDLANDPALVQALQRDLRALGYLHAGLDGVYAASTAAAVRALQFDLLHNDGRSRGADGPAPVAIAEFNAAANGGRAVARVTGIVDADTAGCIDRMLADARVTKLPDAVDPAAENRKALAAVAAFAGGAAPTPFVLAIVQQESGGQQYRVPRRDDDRFVVVGLDRGDAANPDRITSRGYGIGQFTLFHHPPRPEEVDGFILAPVNNVQQTHAALRAKFDRYVVGPADRADDRMREHPLLPLRTCRYARDDPRYLSDCRACAAGVRRLTIGAGTPHYPGASSTYQPDAVYPTASYYAVPDRAEFLCDWPYAVRRYNGGGNDSFHYQARVLLGLLAAPS